MAGQLLRKDKRLTDIYSCVSLESFVAPFSCTGVPANGAARYQTSHYSLDYDDTETSNKFVLRQIHMFGSDGTTEVSPTAFSYHNPNLGWTSRPNYLPPGFVLAGAERLGAAYRFAHFAPDTTGRIDLLFAAQVGGKNVAYAFKNNGPASWVLGGTPWSAAGASDGTPPTSSVSDANFAPPVSFMTADGQDLGVILADVTGSGRTAMMQNYVAGTHQFSAAYLAGAKSFETNTEYKIPFVVSRDGKIVANYRFANWTGGAGPDLIYESEGHKGFLKNGGQGSGQGRVGFLPRIGSLRNFQITMFRPSRSTDGSILSTGAVPALRLIY